MGCCPENSVVANMSGPGTACAVTGLLWKTIMYGDEAVVRCKDKLIARLRRRGSGVVWRRRGHSTGTDQMRSGGNYQ